MARNDQLEILRRIGERGLALAYRIDDRFVDIFQHLLDEIERTAKWDEDPDPN